MPPRITILVPHHNGRALLDIVIPSALAQTHADARVVIVDDASTDGSESYARERWPSVEVLRSERNLGFAATVNRGLRATASEYVAIVNSDVELEPDWLELLVKTLDRYPAAASATGKTLAYRDRGRLDGAGNQMRWSGGATRRGYGHRDRGQFEDPGEVISACAGFAVYRRTAFDAVGLFDEDLVAYYEDVDWGLRAQLAGFSCRYEPRAVAYHIGGATHGSDPRYLRLQRRNQLLVIFKCYPPRALLRRSPQILLGQLVLLARGVRDGSARVQLLATADAARAALSSLPKRAAVQRLRRVDDDALDRLMTPERWAVARWRR